MVNIFWKNIYISIDLVWECNKNMVHFTWSTVRPWTNIWYSCYVGAISQFQFSIVCSLLAKKRAIKTSWLLWLVLNSIVLLRLEWSDPSGWRMIPTWCAIVILTLKFMLTSLSMLMLILKWGSAIEAENWPRMRLCEDQFSFKMLIEFKHLMPSLGQLCLCRCFCISKNLSITANASPVLHFDK